MSRWRCVVGSAGNISKLPERETLRGESQVVIIHCRFCHPVILFTTKLMTSSYLFRGNKCSLSETISSAKWEADKCSKHFSYRLKGKAGTKRPISMTSVKPLAARFYRLKCGHAPTGIYLKRFGYREDNRCRWCEGIVTQTREHLFRHCSRWKDQQEVLWKEVGKVTGWKAGRCRHM